MLSNVCTKIPVNDLKSNGFLDCRSYESNNRTFQIKYDGHKAVYFNYARDLICLFYCSRFKRYVFTTVFKSSVLIWVIAFYLVDGKENRKISNDLSNYCYILSIFFYNDG